MHNATMRDKVALVVIDGLAFDQWLTVQQEITRQRPAWRFEENATFAWVPTITSVSRQAIFAGKGAALFSIEYLLNRQGSKPLGAILGGSRCGKS